MQIIPKENVEEYVLPLPLYKTVHLADVVAKDGELYSILIGLDERLSLQLKNYSFNKNDVELQKYTSDFKRFAQGNYEDWYKKNRTPFALVHRDTQMLASIIWFGPKHLFDDGNNWQTASWRTYVHFRGKGLMKKFALFAFAKYTEKVEGAKFWVILKRDNAGSFILAEALGFRTLESQPNEDSIVMVK